MNNKNYEDRVIRNMFESVETTDYDVSKDVFKRLHAMPRNRLSLKRLIIAVAVLLASVALLGAVKTIGGKVFNLFGERIHKAPLTESYINYDDPFTESDYKFVYAAAPGEERYIVIPDADGSGHSSSSYQADVHTTDFDTFTGYIKESNSPIKIPDYIPEGYSFKSGGIDFFHDENSLNGEMVFSESRDGKIYEIYRFPEGYQKNIDNIWMIFSNEAGNELTYFVYLISTLGENSSFEFHASDSTEVEKIEISGFDTGILAHDKTKLSYYNKALFYREITPITVVDLMSALHPLDIEDWGSNYYTQTKSAMLYVLQADSLEKDEVIKIAESIGQ